jgi:hypothetical protein
VCADALEWLPAHPGIGPIVTSLPDADETTLPVAQWAGWFHEAALACLRAVPPLAPCIFYQTDRKAGGQLHSKAALLFAAAAEAGARVLWHRIVLRRPVGAVDLHRPGYSHLIAFSRHGRPGQATPDVLERGPMVYANAMGLNAALAAVRFAAATPGSETICDPFCGRGTVPAVAEAFGLSAIGVDLDPIQCEAARRLRVMPPGGDAANGSAGLVLSEVHAHARKSP